MNTFISTALLLLLTITSVASQTPTSSEEDEEPTVMAFRSDIFQNFMAPYGLPQRGIPQYLNKEGCEERTRVYSYLACDDKCLNLEQLQSKICNIKNRPREYPDHIAILSVCCPKRLRKKTEEEFLRSLLERKTVVKGGQ